MKTVYTCFCTDVIHDGHLNIIEKAHQRKPVSGEESSWAVFRTRL